MNKKFGILAIILFVAVFVSACSQTSWMAHRDIADWKDEKYLELPSHISSRAKYVSKVIPSEEEVEGYEDVSFYWATYRDDVSIGLGDFAKGLPYTYCACLELAYAEDTYSEQKEKIISEYPYLEEPVPGDDGTFLMPISKGKIGIFDIWIMNDRDEDQPDWKWEDEFTNFPLSFGFIAFNDEQRIIRIAYATDDSIDYYSNVASLETHIRNSFDINWD